MPSPVPFLRERLTRAPHVILVLGSGLGSLADTLDDPVRVPYSEIPGFPHSTVEGHAGELVVGEMAGVEVAVMAGRFHLYEGWDASDVATPIRTMRALGAELLLLTNAAGGLRPGMQPGDLMLIADHINLMGRNPLTGPVQGDEERFPDMSAPYDPEVRRELRACAVEIGVPVEEGVYAGVLGPSYETPAEIRMLRRFGADAVGMSTVPEVIAARAAGLRVGAISCITNLAAGLGTEPLSHEEVLSAGAAARDRLAALVTHALPRLVRPDMPSKV